MKKLIKHTGLYFLILSSTLNSCKKGEVPTAPVTIDDVYYVWLDPEYNDLLRLQDFLAIHIYGQWSNISPENTVSYINDIFNELKI